jgi:hypothetical protein
MCAGALASQGGGTGAGNGATGVVCQGGGTGADIVETDEGGSDGCDCGGTGAVADAPVDAEAFEASRRCL